MMYLFDFFKFIYETLIVEPFSLLFSIGKLIVDVAHSLITLVGAFPLWLSTPFIVLIGIAVLFRVSQFIPTIGGAS